MLREIIILLLLAFSLNVGAERLGLEEVATSRGLLVIQRESGAQHVVLDGERIFATDQYDWAFVEAVYPEKAPAELVLVIFGGGNACEGFRRIIDLRGTGPVKMSAEFGNCNYLVQPEEWKRPELKENPSYKSGAWYIALPSVDHPEKRLTWYVYKDGELVERGKGKIEHGDSDRQYEEKLVREMPDENKRKAAIARHGSAAAAYFAIVNEKARRAKSP